MRHYAKCCADRSNRCRDIVIFGFFRMAAAAILDFKNYKFLQSQRSRGSNCVIVPNLVEIAQTAAEIWQFFNFSRRRPPPFRIFEISNF